MDGQKSILKNFIDNKTTELYNKIVSSVNGETKNLSEKEIAFIEGQLKILDSIREVCDKRGRY